MSRDQIEFHKSLKHLHDNLLRDYVSDGNSVIIALSRKGPKMVDELFTELEQAPMNIVTEFAMPSLFAQVPIGSTYRVYILDDAVYYGSTLKNLIREIREYGKLYDLSLEVRAYVAIRDENSLNLEINPINSTPAWREGYGHFFVKEAMSRFRSLHRCMEVEYPSFSYSLSHPIDEEVFSDILQGQFGQNSYYLEEYDEGSVFNILLPRHDSQFTKLRIYPSSDKLNITMMSPRIIPNDDTVIMRLMNEMNYILKDQWTKLCYKMLKEEGDVKASESLRRNKRRNIISLANFIFSYHEFIYYKSKIDSIVINYDINAKWQGMDDKVLYQLIGDASIADSFLQGLNEHFNLVDFHFPQIPSLPLITTGQNYEELGSPSEEERRTLESHNQHMIRNSQSYNEALSAIFFNQDLFIERWSRHRVGFENRHLWFGYTHETLLDMLDRHGRYEKPEEQTMEHKLHAWVDNRIDMGCIVPQYILDYQTNQWIRVFRPGENEEILLSHLSRFVIHVFNMIDKHLGLGYVPDHFLTNMLVAIYKKYWEEGLNEQFCFNIEIDDSNTLFITDSRDGSKSELIKYLLKMYIMELQDGELTIAPRITDIEFKSNTTIDYDILSKIDTYISEILTKFTEAEIPVDRDYAIFNYYLNSDLSDHQLVEKYQQIAQQMLRIVRMIDTGIDIGNRKFVTNDSHSLILECYHQLLRYDVEINMYTKEKSFDKQTYWSLFESNPRFRTHVQIRRMMIILNLIVSIYVMCDYDSFKEYAESENNIIVMKLMNFDTILQHINKTIQEGGFKTFHTTHHFTRSLVNVLSDIASR